MAGNTSGHSPDFVLTVDTTVAPVSDLQVTDDVAQHTGPLTSGGLTNDATPALSGTAEAGATVTIYDGSTVLGTAVADTLGDGRGTPAATRRTLCSRWTPPWRRSATDVAAHRAADQRRADGPERDGGSRVDGHYLRRQHGAGHRGGG
ncbi:hypothetical protein I4447_005360 [Klebsiella pneumoniae]